LFVDALRRHPRNHTFSQGGRFLSIAFFALITGFVAGVVVLVTSSWLLFHVGLFGCLAGGETPVAYGIGLTLVAGPWLVMLAVCSY